MQTNLSTAPICQFTSNRVESHTVPGLMTAYIIKLSLEAHPIPLVINQDALLAHTGTMSRPLEQISNITVKLKVVLTNNSLIR